MSGKYLFLLSACRLSLMSFDSKTKAVSFHPRVIKTNRLLVDYKIFARLFFRLPVFAFCEIALPVRQFYFLFGEFGVGDFDFDFAV